MDSLAAACGKDGWLPRYLAFPARGYTERFQAREQEELPAELEEAAKAKPGQDGGRAYRPAFLFMATVRRERNGCLARSTTKRPFERLEARAALSREFEQLHREMLRIVREDEVCRWLMTIPGVGPLVAITFKSAIDDPGRIAKSKTVGALFGLVPKKYQSGEREFSGGITRTGDEAVRTALYEAANVNGQLGNEDQTHGRWSSNRADLLSGSRNACLRY
jgi:hypothetical protein